MIKSQVDLRIQSRLWAFIYLFIYFNLTNVFFNLINVDVENCRSFKDFGYIYTYILALRPCDAWLSQNLYVNNFFINLLKINNKNK